MLVFFSFDTLLDLQQCELQGIEIVIIHKGERPRFKQDLAEDILEMITVSTLRKPLQKEP